jgi:pimeloyl-ACP methyl ester carboxylesterase
MWTLLLIPLFFYAAVLLLLFVFQGRLLFPAGLAAGQAAFPEGATALLLRTSDGETLHGLHVPPRRGEGGPIILGFGGNAWNAADAAATLHALFPRHDVVVFHYRGYAPSSGRAAAADLTTDSLAIHDEVVRRFPRRAIIAVGFSVGTGVAAFLATRRDLSGLILVTPFDSLRDVAAGHYPWVPVRLLFRHEMPAAAWLERTRLPVAIIAAERDTLIPRVRTDVLRRHLRSIAFDVTIAGAGHNDIYQHPEFAGAMREALAAVSHSTG